MASAGDQYLPALEELFSRGTNVFSWEDALRNKAWITIENSQRAKELLTYPIPAFPAPSEAARNLFATRISKVKNFVASEKSYDVKQIEDDAQWLSSEVTCSQDEALRLVLIEWEQRPRARLLAGYSEAELASLRDCVGAQDGNAAASFQQVFPNRLESEFDTEPERRKRILLTCFRETIGLLKVLQKIEEAAQNGEVLDTQSSDFANLVAQRRALAISPEVITSSILDFIDTRLKSLDTGRTWSVKDEQVDQSWTASVLEEVLALLDILLLTLRNFKSSTINGDIILRWLRIAAGCDFFGTLQATAQFSPTRVQHLQITISLVSLVVLDPAHVVTAIADASMLSDQNIYCLKADTANEINTILFTAAEACIPQACPAVLGWAMILDQLRRTATSAKEAREGQRLIDTAPTAESTGHRTSHGSMQQTICEDVMESIASSSPVSDPVAYLFRCAVEANDTLEIITSLATSLHDHVSSLSTLKLQILQDLIAVAVANLGYNPDVLAAQFAILDTYRRSISCDSPTGAYEYLSDLSENFIKNDFLMDSMFAVAAARFPYESLPFLRLCKLLATAQIFDHQNTQYITFRLRTLESFTQVAAGPFASYTTVREDENLNLVKLQSAASMIQGAEQKLIAYDQSKAVTSVIDADTLGELVSESYPPVIRWQHTYSGLALLGTWLELHYLGQLQPILPSDEPAHDVVTEIIGILTGLVSSTLISAKTAVHLAQETVLAEASASFGNDTNVAYYIFEIMEQELQAFRQRPSNSFNTSLLTACIEFVAVLVDINPDQFWSSISKSSLLESHGTDSFLLALVTSVEVPSRSFTFLESCCGLYDKTISAILHNWSLNALKNRGTNTLGLQKFKFQAAVLQSLTRSLYSVYDAMPSWMFSSPSRHKHITQVLSESFTQVVKYARGIGESGSAFNRAFVLSSDFLERQIRTKPEEQLGPISVLRHLVLSAEMGLMSIRCLVPDDYTTQYESIISFAQVMSRLGRKESSPPSSLELQLFNSIPLLIRILSVDVGSQSTSLVLIEDLLKYVGETQPVSLLGHLGSASSIDFVNILRVLQDGSASPKVVESTWRLLSTLVGRNQQWLALVILTGSPPEKHKTSKDEGSTVLRGKALLEVAVSKLMTISETSSFEHLIAIFEFVIHAQQSWSWTADVLKSSDGFFASIVAFLGEHDLQSAENTVGRYYINKIASLFTELVTIHLHSPRALQEKNNTPTIITLLHWLADNAIDVASYNVSLHANLRRNFANKFNGLDVTNFKRTVLNEAPYGPTYYYDVDFASKVLQQEKSWQGQPRAQDQSFMSEFVRANNNFSVVDSEMKLLHSFENLCVEHCTRLARQNGSYSDKSSANKNLHAIFIHIIRKCLQANTQICPSHKIFENVLQVRADLTIAVLQKLIDAKARGFEARELLKLAWDCAKIKYNSFEEAINNSGLVYWRSMLVIIALAMQFHVGKALVPPAFDQSNANLLQHTLDGQIPSILEIVTVVVGQGFKSIVTAIQDQHRSGKALFNGTIESTITPKDVSLVMTIFETILRMSRMPELVTEVSERLISTGILQSCLLLYSWAHTLTGPQFENEPIFADDCLQLLGSLSSLPPVTEEMAVEGVLSRLLSGRVSQKLQSVPDGVGHLDKRPHCQYLYRLWATGILPICLNLLHSVGAPIAAEVSIFLNQFPKQLSRASTTFIPVAQPRGASGSVTLASANEAATLALISFVLKSYRNAGASAAVDPSTILSLSVYDDDNKALTEDISDIIDATMQSLQSMVVATNEKEVSMMKIRDGDGSLLVKKVRRELENALICLKGQSTEEDEN